MKIWSLDKSVRPCFVVDCRTDAAADFQTDFSQRDFQENSSKDWGCTCFCFFGWKSWAKSLINLNWVTLNVFAFGFCSFHFVRYWLDFSSKSECGRPLRNADIWTCRNCIQFLYVNINLDEYQVQRRFDRNRRMDKGLFIRLIFSKTSFWMSLGFTWCSFWKKSRVVWRVLWVWFLIFFVRKMVFRCQSLEKPCWNEVPTFSGSGLHAEGNWSLRCFYHKSGSRSWVPSCLFTFGSLISKYNF